MGSGKKLTGQLSVEDVRRYYRGHTEVAKAIVFLMGLDPPWRVFDEGHGTRLYCPCGARPHQFGAPHTPPDDRWAAKTIERSARKFRRQHKEDTQVDEC